MVNNPNITRRLGRKGGKNHTHGKGVKNHTHGKGKAGTRKNSERKKSAPAPKLKNKPIVGGELETNGFIQTLINNKDFEDVSQYVLSDVYKMVNDIKDKGKLKSLLKTRVYFETDRGFKWILSVLLPAYLKVEKIGEDPLQICDKSCIPESRDSSYMDIFKKFICDGELNTTDLFYAYQTGKARQVYFSETKPNKDGFSDETVFNNSTNRRPYQINHRYISHAKEAEYEAINFREKFKTLFDQSNLNLAGIENDGNDSVSFNTFVSIGSTSTQAWKYNKDNGEPVIIIPPVNAAVNEAATAAASTIFELFGAKTPSDKITDTNIEMFIKILESTIESTEGNILFFNAIGYQVVGGKTTPPQKINENFVKDDEKLLLRRILNKLPTTLNNRIYIVPRKYEHKFALDQKQISAEWVSALYEEKKHEYILDVGGGSTYLYTNGKKYEKGLDTKKFDEEKDNASYINELCNKINTYLVHELNINDITLKNVKNYITDVNNYLNQEQSKKEIVDFFEKIDKELKYKKDPASDDIQATTPSSQPSSL